MACTSIVGLQRSDSGNELRCFSGMRRSRSEPQLRSSLTVPRVAAPPSRLTSSRSSGMFPFHLPSNLLPNAIRSLLFDESPPDVGNDGIEVATPAEDEIGAEKRANWVERILELRSRWKDRQHRDEDDDIDDDDDIDKDYTCGVSYESEEEEEEWNRESFSRFLTRVSWTETKLFSKLAYLCNLAYVITDIKAEELRRYYDLRFVTSSLVKKLEAAAIANLEVDSNRPPPAAASLMKRPIRHSTTYGIAASAASYVHSLGDDGDEEIPPVPVDPSSGRVHKSEVAAYVTASTMTAVVAAEEEARLEAARDLRSLHSSPCEWFVCDNPNTFTRCFVIQGSDSLASWQANLFFEPTKFEGLDVLVHRGIYEAAKGIYEQFMPEIQSHLQKYGDRARLRFTGHSLGGSLSLLVSLMLLSRGAVPSLAVLPVVTFGSPSVFCGGRHVLDELGLDEGHVRSVMMHRDIVPRAFSCNYPNHVAQVLKRLNSAFRSHPCLNNDKLLYSPLGQMYILQPEEKASPSHPLLPEGAALYELDRKRSSSALKAFLNTPHPLETLSDPSAYGSEGTILRDHDSSNYLKAVNGLLRLYTRAIVRQSKKKRLHEWWSLLTTPHDQQWEHNHQGLVQQVLAAKEIATGV